MQNTMNLLLLGATSLPVGYMAFGFISLIVPPKYVPAHARGVATQTLVYFA
jgi:hypothetical protein